MDNIKKSFLRSCINYGCLTVENATNILISLCSTYKINKQDDIRDFVQDINSHLSQFNQKLTFYKHPLATETEFLVFGLTFTSDACKRQMHFTEAERHYFLKLMEAIVNQEDYGISWLNVYNVVDTLSDSSSSNAERRLTKHRVQELIEMWKDQGYFLEKGETLYLGPRMLVEYETHLKMNYAESMENCILCGNLVLWGIKCQECETKIHRDCIRTYLIRKSNCPSCKKIWNTRLSSSQE